MEQKKIKICGLTRREDVEAVNQYRPDYAGFIFAPGKRQVSFRNARELKKILSPEIPAVGVFLNGSIDDIVFLAKRNIIDLIQLHGEEDGEYIAALKKRMGQELPDVLPIIKAIRVQSSEDIQKAETLPVDYLLLDSCVKGAYGGSGKSFDWSLIPPLKKPWFLAGGIGASNIEEAKKTSACCLDVSSLVETDGKKDPEKIKEIIQMVRN